MLLFESCIALDLPRFVFDFDIARLDKLAVGFEGCLNQSVVPADKKVSFFHYIANLHRDLEDSSADLRGEEDSVGLLNRAATPDYFFKSLSADWHGFDRCRRVDYPSFCSVGADHVKHGFKHKQSQKKTDNEEDYPVGALHFSFGSLVSRALARSKRGLMISDFVHKAASVPDQLESLH
jgi:hypothetical protein